MGEPVTISPGFARRIDLFAVANERASRRAFWVFGAMSLWALIGVVSAVILGDWAVVVILLCMVLLSGLAGGLVLRANRRVPETKRWLAELSGTADSA
jgi:hypothetical protein